MQCDIVMFERCVVQIKYQSAFGARSVHIVTPDWIIRCVEAMSCVDEMRYHPRLLLILSHETQLTSSVIQHDANASSSSLTVLDTSSNVRPLVSATEKCISFVPVPAIPMTIVSQQHIQTHLRSIENENEYLTEVCQSPLKLFHSTTVSI